MLALHLVRVEVRGRGGFTLFELAVAFLLVGGVLMTLGPLLHRAAQSRRAAEVRQLALLEAGNLMERFARGAWDEITPGAAEALEISPELRRRVPQAQLAATVEPDAGTPSAKRVQIEIRWPDAAGRPASPVRLVAWVYALEKQ